MDEASLASRISKISTIWMEVAQAHGEACDPKARAQRAIIERYSGAIYRYLFGAVRDPDAAEELFQEFALDFVRGGLRHADPSRGRFRDYVKSVLSHLVSRYRKRQRSFRAVLDPERVGPDPAVELPEPDQAFIDAWRAELLSRAWAGLSALQGQTGQPYFAVLRFRTDNPVVASTEMAAKLTEQLGPEKPFSDASIRKTLQRARERFADLLVDEVTRSLEDATPDRIEEELIDLRLWPYCRPALARQRPGGSEGERT